MIRRLSVVTILSALILSGCATGPLLSEVMRAQVGRDINDIIRNGGRPASQYVMPNGNTVYVWRFEQFSTSPAFVGGYTVIPSETTHRHCSAEFEVDRTNRVVSVRSVGNACPERL